MGLLHVLSERCENVLEKLPERNVVKHLHPEVLFARIPHVRDDVHGPLAATGEKECLPVVEQMCPLELSAHDLLHVGEVLIRELTPNEFGSSGPEEFASQDAELLFVRDGAAVRLFFQILQTATRTVMQGVHLHAIREEVIRQLVGGAVVDYRVSENCSFTTHKGVPPVKVQHSDFGKAVFPEGTGLWAPFADAIDTVVHDCLLDLCTQQPVRRWQSRLRTDNTANKGKSRMLLISGWLSFVAFACWVVDWGVSIR